MVMAVSTPTTPSCVGCNNCSPILAFKSVCEVEMGIKPGMRGPGTPPSVHNWISKVEKKCVRAHSSIRTFLTPPFSLSKQTSKPCSTTWRGTTGAWLRGSRTQHTTLCRSWKTKGTASNTVPDTRRYSQRSSLQKHLSPKMKLSQSSSEVLDDFVQNEPRVRAPSKDFHMLPTSPNSKKISLNAVSSVQNGQVVLQRLVLLVQHRARTLKSGREMDR